MQLVEVIPAIQTSHEVLTTTIQTITDWKKVVAVESDTYYSNYKDVEGMILPGQIENRYNGVTGELIVIDRYEVDTPYPQSDFNKPAVA